MKNKQLFCSRKGGAMIKGIFYPHPTVVDILSREARRKADKIERKLGRRR